MLTACVNRDRGLRSLASLRIRPSLHHIDIDKALDIVRERLIKMLPGEPWQGVRG